MECIKAFMKNVDKISEKQSRLKLEEIEQSVSVLTRKQKNVKPVLSTTRDRICYERKEKRKCLLTACVCFLSLTANILLEVCLYRKCANILQGYRQEANCDINSGIFTYEDKQIWDLRSTEALVSLIKIALIAKTSSTTTFSGLQDKKRHQNYSRSAVNFVFDASSSQDSGLLWTKSSWFESNSFNITGGLYNEGAVSIPQTGFYALYNSFCLLKQNHCRGDCNKKQKIHHKLFMKKNDSKYANYKKGKTLLFHKEILLGSTEMEYHTSHLFDILHLEKGYVLYPWLSDISFVYKYSVLSQWGLLAL